MKEIILPFYYGQEISIKGLDQKAIIIAIMIDESSVQYKCSWFAKGERQTDWFAEFEIDTPEESKQLQIGFKRG